ncbi:MAG TPA: hypothetical protein VGN23_08835 [Verrucomicrobiae bacterium]
MPFMTKADSLVYQGLLNTSLGGATFTATSSELYVSNLSSGGQDGVGITLPDNLTKLDVGWNALDPSNALPVGAYIQTEFVGSSSGSTMVYGALRETKAGTSNYVISVNFSPVGAKTYTVQAYYHGVLAGQATGQSGTSLAVAQNAASTVDEICDGNGGLLLSLDGATSMSIAGQVVTCDNVEISPENIALPGAPTTFRIVASQIPFITITSENESLEYQGLMNTSLGGAAMNAVSSELYVSNLSSGGQDGVGITMPDGSAGLNMTLGDLDPSNSVPVGAYVQSQLVGTDNGITNGVLGTLTASKAGSNFEVGANFSAMGASTYTVLAYNQGVLVAQAMDQGSTSLAVSASAFQNIKNLGYDDSVADCCVSNLSSGGQDGLTIGFAGGTSISVGGQLVTCDQLMFVPDDVMFPTTPTAFQIVGSSVPSMTINSENESAEYQGLINTSLGGATMEAVSGGEVISNLSSSGQDGVGIAMPSGSVGLDVALDDLDPSNSAPSGAYIQSQFTGQGTGNTVLGTLTAIKSGSNYEVGANFSAMGASTYTVQAYDQGVLVGQATGQGSTSLAVSASTFQTINSFGLEDSVAGCCVSNLSSGGQDGLTISFAGGTSMSFGGQEVTCDQLEFVPDNVIFPGAATAFQIVGSSVPVMTINSENESQKYQGLVDTSLGGATMNAVSSELYVSNLSSSGQDGVGIAVALGDGSGHINKIRLAISDLDPSNSLPIGAYIQSQLVGTDDGTTNGVLGTLTASKAGSNFEVSVNFSAMGASAYTVLAYDQGVLVAQATNQNSATLMESASSFQNINNLGYDDSVADCCVSNLSSGGQDGLTIGFVAGTAMSVGGQMVTCDQLEFVPYDVMFPASLTGFQIVGASMPVMAITSVEVSPLRVGVSQNGQGITLQWSGSAVLQESTDLSAWTDDTNVTSPYAVVPNRGGPSKFYRLVYRP